MELINAGDVPLDRVVHSLFSDTGLRKLIGQHGTACFVLVRSGLAPGFHEKLIENTETIDATTRNHIAFIVFHGNDSSVVRRPPDGYQAYENHLAGLSVSRDSAIWLDEHHGDPVDLQFDREFADSLRYSSRAMPVRRIARAMDVATSVLMERFEVPEQALPCLLFVDGSSLKDAQLVELSPEGPMESLYKDVLAPLGDEFRTLEFYWEQRNKIAWRLDSHKEAASIVEGYPDKLKVLEETLARTNAALSNPLNAPDDKGSELVKERDQLTAYYLSFKNATLDERFARIPQTSSHYAAARDLKARLAELENQRREAYSEPQTEEKRQIIGRLNASVNRLRGKFGTVLGMHLTDLRDRPERLTAQIKKLELTTEQLRRNVHSTKSEIRYFRESKARAEKTIADFATFDLQMERGREAEALNRLRELGYGEGFLSAKNPRAIDTVRIMAAHGRLGYSRPPRIDAKGPCPQERFKILFLAANPTRTTRLDLEEEIRLIEGELRGTKYRDGIVFVARQAVRPDDLVRLVREEIPSIIHFSGHGAAEGIILRDDGVKGYNVVHGKALSRLLRDRGVKMVVLNACFSMEQASDLSSAVDTVVGTTSSVGDEAARRFSGAFYRTLGNGHSIADAFRDAGDLIALLNLKDVFQVIGKTHESLLRPQSPP